MLIFAAALLAPSEAIRAQPIPPHPIPEAERWATVTHAGNEPFVYQTSGGSTRTIGRVDHEYQIMRTEVTVAEWYEFVVAYSPYVNPQQAGSFEFTGSGLLGGPGSYTIASGQSNKPTRVGWRYAARYSNWLHNGRANTPEAFESGVYDTSTFGDIPNGGGFTDQQTRSPGATYWIPSEDEWVKSVYYDPHKNGPDQPGYWTYPISSDTRPNPGVPGVGQTSAGPNSQPEAFPLPDVASYPDFQSPWGLLDASGGRREWTESFGYQIGGPALPQERTTRGAGWNQIPYAIFFHQYDRVDYLSSAFPTQLIGLRLARAVPGAPGAGVFLCTLTLILQRRRMSRVDSILHCSCHVYCRVPEPCRD